MFLLLKDFFQLTFYFSHKSLFQNYIFINYELNKPKRIPKGKSQMDNPENWQQDEKAKQKHNTICVGQYYTQTHTNDLSKPWALLQTNACFKQLPTLTWWLSIMIPLWYYSDCGIRNNVQSQIVVRIYFPVPFSFTFQYNHEKGRSRVSFYETWTYQWINFFSIHLLFLMII